MVRKDGLLGAWKRPRGRNTRAGLCLNPKTMSVYETQPEGRTETEHATIVEDGPRWKGPFTERDKYGEPTGARFVRCTGYGVEVLEVETEHATHRDGCDGVDE